MYFGFNGTCLFPSPLQLHHTCLNSLHPIDGICTYLCVNYSELQYNPLVCLSQFMHIVYHVNAIHHPINEPQYQKPLWIFVVHLLVNLILLITSVITTSMAYIYICMYKFWMGYKVDKPGSTGKFQIFKQKCFLAILCYPGESKKRMENHHLMNPNDHLGQVPNVFFMS